MKILIVGGEGTIGKKVKELLRRNMKSSLREEAQEALKWIFLIKIQ